MDLTALLDHWRYLDVRYFSRLDHRFAGSVKKFELCLLRYYLIYGNEFLISASEVWISVIEMSESEEEVDSTHYVTLNV